MKKFFTKKTILLLLVMTVGILNTWAESVKWMKKSPSELAPGDVIVIVDITTGVAMSNDPAADKAPSATSVTLNDGKDQLTGEIAANLQWTLEDATGSKCYFKVGDNYLYVTDADDGLRVGDPTDKKYAFGLVKDENNNNADFLAVDMDGENSRIVGVKNKYISKSWNTKTSIDSDINKTVIAFFKKVESNLPDAGIKWTNTFQRAGDNNAYAQADDYTQKFKNREGTEEVAAPSLDNPNELTGFTFESSRTDVATVDGSGVVTLVGRGTSIITAKFSGNESYDEATVSYTLLVDTSHPDSLGTYTKPFEKPSKAISYIKTNGNSGGSNYFVMGRVSKIETSSSTSSFIPGLSTETGNEGTLTYYISDDGTEDDATNKELKISCGRKRELNDLTEKDICVGDLVMVAGPLILEASKFSIGGRDSGGSGKKDSKTPKMETVNYIHEHTRVLTSGDANIYLDEVKDASTYYSINNPDGKNITGTVGTPTIESSKTDVVSYDGETGKLTALKVGSSVITVTVPVTDVRGTGDGSYNMVSKFTLTVKSRDVAPYGDGSYQLVTSASQLQEGDRLLIVAEKESKNYALGTKQNDADRASKEVTVSENTISSVPEDAQIVVLEEDGSGKWLFRTADNYYLYASSSSADELKSADRTTVGDNGKATIAIDGETNVATITFAGANTHNVLKFNAMMISTFVISSKYACYTSEDTENTMPKLYRFVPAATYNVTMGSTGWRTLVSSADVASLPTGLKAYVVSRIDDEKIEGQAVLKSVSSVKAGKPYILNGEAGETYTMTVGDSDENETNELLISDANTTNGVYVLGTVGGVTAFYTWSGNRLGSGRVYLPISAPARLSIVFEDETTGISDAVRVNEEKTNNPVVYDLQGRSVKNPQRGLYIINGRKVVIK